MVNWVEAQKPLLHWMLKNAGLIQQTVEIEPGTIMTIWVPKEKKLMIKKKSSSANEIVPEGKPINGVSGNYEKITKRDDEEKKLKEKPPVVLLHGFAAEGAVTWQFQFAALTKEYDVYIPDLLFFGGSTTVSAHRSPEFQAECLTKVLEHLGVELCTVVGFSYGGMVAFKMAETRPELVRSLIISGSVIAMTDSISESTLQQLGFSSSAELLMPETVKGLKALLSVSMYKKLWFPNFLYKDFLEVMFSNRKEREQLLQGLVVSNKDAKVPLLPQRIFLLWGENDNIFNIELAKNMKERLGEKVSFHSIKKGGHLVHLERPCVYNSYLKKFLAEIYDDQDTKEFI